ncbi:hypothetical protein ABW19_dt0209401 [Dactylella cylindrospora]|nr:hypothetical protein ABW19_dt0209401 [Dactylella cylindrospora]
MQQFIKQRRDESESKQLGQKLPNSLTYAEHGRRLQEERDTALQKIADLEVQFEHSKSENCDLLGEIAILKQQINLDACNSLQAELGRAIMRHNQLTFAIKELKKGAAAEISRLQTDREHKIQEAVRAQAAEVMSLQEEKQRLEGEVARYKKKLKNSDEQRIKAEDLALQNSAEVKRLQRKEYEANCKGDILLDEEVQKKFENIFGQKLRSWIRQSFRGMDKTLIIPIVQEIQKERFVDKILCFDGFIAPVPFVLEKVGAITFFEILVTATLVRMVFSDPFFLTDPDTGEILNTFKDKVQNLDTVSACVWTSKTVQLAERLAIQGQQQSTVRNFDTINNFNSYSNRFCDYVDFFLKANKKMTGARAKESRAKLERILRECAEFALDLHKRTLKFLTIDRNSLFGTPDRITWDHKNMSKYCTIHKGNDEDFSGGGKNHKIAAIITPGFTKTTNADGKPLDEEIVWFRAVVCLVDEDEMAKLDGTSAITSSFSSVHAGQNANAPTTQILVSDIKACPRIGGGDINMQDTEPGTKRYEDSELGQLSDGVKLPRTLEQGPRPREQGIQACFSEISSNPVSSLYK